MQDCELCRPSEVVFENGLAYARPDSNALSRGHMLVVPKRHVAQAHRLVEETHSPDGYNIGVNIGRAGGQARMPVHVHLIPRYAGDVPDPRGGIRCVLKR